MTDEVNEGTTPQENEVEQVEITEATIEQLDAYLENAVSENGLEENEEAEVSTVEETEESKEATTKGEEPEDSESKEETTETPEELQEKLAKAKEQIAQQEQFLKRRSTELGEARKERAKYKELYEQKIEEVKDSDPFQAVQLQKELDAIEEQEVALGAEQEEVTRRMAAARIISDHATTEVTPEKLANILRKDGLPEPFLKQFEKDPYVQMHPETLIQVVKRMEEDEVAQAEIRRLKSELDSYKKKNGDVFNKIKEASKQNGISAANKSGVSTSGVRSISDREIANMTTEQLDELIRKTG